MLYIIKDRNYFFNEMDRLQNSSCLHVEHISLKELMYLVEERIYTNIFLEDNTHINIISTLNLNEINIYMLVNNISLIKTSTLMKSHIIMNNTQEYTKYLEAIKQFLEHKHNVPEIPNHLQRNTIRYFIIENLTLNKDRKDFKNLVKEMMSIFYYYDYKVCLHMLYILNQQQSII